MISYSTNQRRSLRWDGSAWQEEVLAASGVEVDDANFTAITGTDVQVALDAIDNVLEGLTATPASGVIMIDDVAQVSGISTGTLANLDVITMPSGSDSAFKFSFSVPAQPVDPVFVRLVFSPATSGASGTFSGTLDYNLFDVNDDLTPGSAYAYSSAVSQSIVSGDFEKMKILNVPIALANFSSGSAPFVVDCKFTRDTSVGGNYAGTIAMVQLYADNIPGATTGNQAGYVGGNLVVTGDLTVEGLTVLQGGTPPASGTDVGISGSLVLDDNFIYVATTTNTWKRTAISSF